MKRSNDQGWQVELPCPQCGAPVVLEETERIFTCSFCRVKHALACKDYFRYCLVPGIPSSPDVFHAPYWRYRGILFSCQADGRIRHRVVDSSFRATAAAFFPNSLGVRPQALKLRLVTASTVGRFWKVNCPHDQLLRTIEEGYGSPDDSTADLCHSALVGERLSLIYSPVLLRDNVLYDAVLDAPLVKASDNAIEQLKSCDERSDSFEPVKFIPALCPQCGWDLDGDKDTLVLCCSNCDSAWEFTNSGLAPLAFSIFPETQDTALYLPFWRIRTEMEGVQLRSYGDLVRLANLPKVVKGGAAEKEFYFWVPAFKVNPRLFLRTARLVTLWQPDDGPPQRRSGVPFHPVTLPVGAAVDALRVMVADLAVPKRQIMCELTQIGVKRIERLLVYLPFTARGNEVIHREMQIGLSGNALRLGKLI